MPRQVERVDDRYCWLGAVVVGVGEEAVGWEARLEQATVFFQHGKLCRLGVH